ncbi:hypothetical protein AHAS_Ahas15G0241900 [Arachis hypogaea]
MFSEWVQLDIFYYGLIDMARMSLDHFAGSSIHIRKTIEEANELIEKVPMNEHLYSVNETSMKGEVKAIPTESIDESTFDDKFWIDLSGFHHINPQLFIQIA